MTTEYELYGAGTIATSPCHYFGEQWFQKKLLT